MSRAIYLNGTDHIAGRLASTIAKHLLENFEIHLFFCESIRYAFPMDRARKIYKSYLHKRCVVKPSKGPFHYVEPSQYFRRMVKRMLKHKTKRGANALARLHVHDSIDNKSYDLPLQVCPNAMLKIKAKPIRKSTAFGDLLKDFGWKRSDIVKTELANYKEYREMKDAEANSKAALIAKMRMDPSIIMRMTEILSTYE